MLYRQVLKNNTINNLLDTSKSLYSISVQGVPIVMESAATMWFGKSSVGNPIVFSCIYVTSTLFSIMLCPVLVF